MNDLQVGTRFLYHRVGGYEIFEGRVLRMSPSGKFMRIEIMDKFGVLGCQWVEYNTDLREPYGITILEILDNGTGDPKD